MGSFSLSGSFTNVSDPNFQSYGTPEFGKFLNGKPVRQGWESGVLQFPPLNSGAFNELYSRYLTNRNAQVSGALPKLSGYGWRVVTAYFHEPLPTGWDGTIAHGVTMTVSRIT